MRCYEIKADEYYYLTDLEVLALREDFKSAMKKVKMLVDLTKESSYRLPSGLSREERRKWISDIDSKLLTKNSEEENVVNND